MLLERKLSGERRQICRQTEVLHVSEKCTERSFFNFFFILNFFVSLLQHTVTCVCDQFCLCNKSFHCCIYFTDCLVKVMFRETEIANSRLAPQKRRPIVLYKLQGYASQAGKTASAGVTKAWIETGTSKVYWSKKLPQGQIQFFPLCEQAAERGLQPKGTPIVKPPCFVT